MNFNKEEKIRDKIIKDYSGIIKMIPVNTNEIDIKPDADLDIETLLDDLADEYNIILTYVIFESKIRIYIMGDD